MSIIWGKPVSHIHYDKGVDSTLVFKSSYWQFYLRSMAEDFRYPLLPGFFTYLGSDVDTDNFVSKFRHLVDTSLCSLCEARAAVFSLQLTPPSEMVVAERDRWTVRNRDIPQSSQNIFFYLKHFISILHWALCHDNNCWAVRNHYFNTWHVGSSWFK